MRAAVAPSVTPAGADQHHRVRAFRRRGLPLAPGRRGLGPPLGRRPHPPLRPPHRAPAAAARRPLPRRRRRHHHRLDGKHRRRRRQGARRRCSLSRARRRAGVGVRRRGRGRRPRPARRRPDSEPTRSALRARPVGSLTGDSDAASSAVSRRPVSSRGVATPGPASWRAPKRDETAVQHPPSTQHTVASLNAR